MSFAQRWEEVRGGFERSFWVANVSELFERLSYYAAFASLTRYLHETLNFPTERAADLSGLFGGLVWFLAIFGGAIVTEQIFRVPGIGSLLISSILANDTPVIMSITFVFSCLVVLFNLIADLLYGWLDPRVSYS